MLLSLHSVLHRCGMGVRVCTREKAMHFFPLVFVLLVCAMYCKQEMLQSTVAADAGYCCSCTSYASTTWVKSCIQCHMLR